MSISASYLARRLRDTLSWETHSIEQIEALGERRISNIHQLNHLSLNQRVKTEVERILSMIPRGSQEREAPDNSEMRPSITPIRASPRNKSTSRPKRILPSNDGELNNRFLESINAGDLESADAMIDAGQVSQKDVDQALYNIIDSDIYEEKNSTVVYLFNTGANPLTFIGDVDIFELAIKRRNDFAIMLFKSYGFTPAQHRFFNAVRKNDIESVREIYRSGGGETMDERRRGYSLALMLKEEFSSIEPILATPDSITAALETALTFANAWQSQEVIEFLKGLGASDSLIVAETMFSWANLDVLNVLLKNYIRNYDTTLSYAAQGGRNDVIEFMKHENVAQFKDSALKAAINYPETVKLLTTLPGYDPKNSVGLATAAEHGKYDLVVFFYENGEYNALDDALKAAVVTPLPDREDEYIRIVDFLVSKDADYKNSFEPTEYYMALHLLRIFKREGVTNSDLIKYIAQINDEELFDAVNTDFEFTDAEITSALPFAVKEKAFNIVPIILQRGGDPNGRSNLGTHSQVAVANNDLYTLTALYDGGAVFDKNLEQRAAQLGYRDLARYIHEKLVKTVYRPTTVESIIHFDRIAEGDPYSMCSLHERHIWEPTDRIEYCPFKDGGVVRPEKFINRVEPSVKRVLRSTDEEVIVDFNDLRKEELEIRAEYVMCSHNNSHIWLPDSRVTTCPFDGAKPHSVVYINE